MAKGFVAGLFQGAAVCGLALMGLSLALPQPPRPGDTAAKSSLADGASTQPATAAAPTDATTDPMLGEGPAPDDAPVDAMAQPTDPVTDRAATTDAPAQDADGQDGGAAMQALPVPEASEFARSGDVAPPRPAALDGQTARQSDGPAVALPADEAAPRAADPVSLRPQIRAEAPSAPDMTMPAPDPVDLPAPADEAPIPVPPPGRVATPDLDRAVDRGSDQAPDVPPLGAADPIPPEASAAGPDAVESDGADAATASESPTDPQPGDPQPADTVAAPADAEPAEAEPAETEPAATASGAAPDTAPDAAAADPRPDAAASTPDLSMPPDFGALRLTD